MIRTLGKLTGAVLSAALLASASCSLVLGLEEAKVKPTISDAGTGGGGSDSGTTIQCSFDSDCLFVVGPCEQYTCRSNVCELGIAPDNTPCSSDPGSFCLEGTCNGPSCKDSLVNGSESDVDCGGICAPCELNQYCNSAKDCTSFNCNKVCIPSCVNGQQDGSETDTDCGGSCPPCVAGGKCIKPEDCVSTVCTANLCK